MISSFILLGWFVVSQNNFDPMNMPKLTSYVNDFSQILSPSDLTEVNTFAQNYETQTTNQFVTVLFPHRNGNELFDIGMKLFNENKIGQVWKNNGLLLLIATEEKKIRIIVWYWLEGDLPDALVKRIIEKDIRPLVDKGDFVWAVRIFYQRCSEALQNDEAANMATSLFSQDQKEEWYWIFGMILWFILASLIKQKKIWKKTKKILVPLLIWVAVLFLIWLGWLILIWLIAGLVFGFTWFLPWRGGRWFGGWWFWWFSGGGFSWWWWSSGWWGAGD